MKLQSMSTTIVAVLKQLAKNQGLARLLVNDISDPYSLPVNEEVMDALIDPSSQFARIFPYSFDAEATTKDGSFIRVYYNDGRFNSNETIAQSDLHIDIVVARSLWLVSDKSKDRSYVRPYEIAGLVVDNLGRNSIGSSVKLKFDGYQHIYVNTKFDAIRLYANYMSIETSKEM